MPHPQAIAGNKIIAFPPLAARTRRVELREDGERGRILLFTGVRYERLRDDAIEIATDERPARRDEEIWS